MKRLIINKIMITPKRNIRFLEAGEIHQIIDAIPDDLRGRRDRALLEVLFSTGLRISEALALKRDDLLRGIPHQTLELVIIGKGGYQRVVYVSPGALQAVFRYFAGRRDNDEGAFLVGKRQVQLMVKVRAKEAGIDKFISPHVFRHSLATDLLRRGVDIRFVSEFLGHRSLANTQIYTHVVNEDLRRIHKRLYK